MYIPGNIEFVQQAGIIGTPEIIVIVVVVLLLFGGKKIPELMRGMGKGVKEFKDGMSGNTDDKAKQEDQNPAKENK
jgi:sec-independent protein translocase protein TatA